MTRLEYLTNHGYNVRLEEDCPDLFMKTFTIRCSSNMCEECWNKEVPQEEIEDLYPPEDFED